MFVIRIFLDDVEQQSPRFKAFEKKPDAIRYFNSATILAHRDEIEDVALFEVAGLGVREAINAVKSGDAHLVSFMDRAVCYRRQIETLALNINLSDLLE